MSSNRGEETAEGQRGCLLTLAKVVYFPSGLLASCYLAFPVALKTILILRAVFNDHNGLIYYSITSLGMFLFFPAWVAIFFVICIIAFFRLLRSPKILMMTSALFALLSVLLCVALLHAVSQ